MRTNWRTRTQPQVPNHAPASVLRVVPEQIADWRLDVPPPGQVASRTVTLSNPRITAIINSAGNPTTTDHVQEIEERINITEMGDTEEQFMYKDSYGRWYNTRNHPVDMRDNPHIGSNLRCYIDGVEVTTRCYGACEAERWVDCYVLNSDGRVRINGTNEPVTERLIGKVLLVQKDINIAGPSRPLPGPLKPPVEIRKKPRRMIQI